MGWVSARSSGGHLSFMSFAPSSLNARLQAAQGYLGLGMAQEAWDELEKIEKKERLNFVAFWKVQVEVARALGKWKLVAEVARHLAKVEPDESLHVFNLAQAMRQLEGPESALAVYEFAADRWPDFAHLRVAMAVELCALGRVEDAKRMVKVAVQKDPQLREVILDHPGLEAVW
jgi:tetratricopeptide (TPR) repeat protein